MKIDEETRNAFLAPLMGIQDIPAFDCDGEYQLEESDFWNIYTPDEMNIPEAEKESLICSRNNVKQYGELFRQDVEKFFDIVPDQKILKAAADMLFSLDSFSELYSGLMQYSETLEQIAELEQTISELEPIAKKQPGLLATVERLKAERDRLKEKLHKPRHGEIRRCYNLFLLIYSHANNGECPVTEREFENWCKGDHAPPHFPIDSWNDPVKLADFVGKYDRLERTQAGSPIHGMTEEEISRKKLK